MRTAILSALALSLSALCADASPVIFVRQALYTLTNASDVSSTRLYIEGNTQQLLAHGSSTATINYWHGPGLGYWRPTFLAGGAVVFHADATFPYDEKKQGDYCLAAAALADGAEVRIEQCGTEYQYRNNPRLAWYYEQGKRWTSYHVQDKNKNTTYYLDLTDGKKVGGRLRLRRSVEGLAQQIWVYGTATYIA